MGGQRTADGREVRTFGRHFERADAKEADGTRACLKRRYAAARRGESERQRGETMVRREGGERDETGRDGRRETRVLRRGRVGAI